MAKNHKAYVIYLIGVTLILSFQTPAQAKEARQTAQLEDVSFKFDGTIVNLDGVQEAGHAFIQSDSVQLGGEELLDSVSNILAEKGSLETLPDLDASQTDIRIGESLVHGALDTAVSQVLYSVNTISGPSNFQAESPSVVTLTVPPAEPKPVSMEAPKPSPK